MNTASRGFWDALENPIIGMAPMDGITDATFRWMMNKYSRPSITFTEFTNVEGLHRGATIMLEAFEYDVSERPVIAQIYGVEPEAYYTTALLLCAMGFDGIDINMGCPANKVAKQGSGAGLILTPQLAQQLVRVTQQACLDWADGLTLKKGGVHPDIIQAARLPKNPSRKLLPVSIKTRIGYHEDVSHEWIPALLETNPANITVHGRTLKQMYTGRSNWDAIAKTAELTHRTAPHTTLLGNGDVKSMDDAREKIKNYGVDGVLVGRAIFGNPWFFGLQTPTAQEQLNAAIEHCHAMQNRFPEKHFASVRKHLVWYCQKFPGASQIRHRLMTARDAHEVEKIIRDALAQA